MAIAVLCKSCGHQFRSSDSHRGKTAACTHCAAQLLVDGKQVPDFDVFVSHSTKDKQIADAVVAALEASKLRCWVAPRDIPPGAEWSSSIIDAIANSRIMVLIYSSHSNASPQVLREVERAVSKGVSVTPLRIDDAPMSKGMEYFISASHWLDAMTPPLETHMTRLVRTLRAMVEQDYEVKPARRPSVLEPAMLRKPGGMKYVLAIIGILAFGVVLAARHGPWRARTSGPSVPTSATARSTTVAANNKSPASDLAALKALLDRASRRGPRVPMAVGEPVRSDTTLKANDNGYSLDDTLQIGNSLDTGQTGETFRGSIRAEPGFCLEGGKLLVGNGKLDLLGTEQKPCILIGVTLICKTGATVRATHTFFENCTFGKGGYMFSTGGYSSKWTFENCILRKSNFNKLDRITYGIKWKQCSFIDCTFPQRHWGYYKFEGPDDDAAALARGEWSRIDKCDFYGCQIPPSIFWCMNSCNAYACKVAGDPEIFQSHTNLEVVIGLVPGPDTTVANLRANTAVNGTGKVIYASVPYMPRQ